jgi:uncharacterized repeat protein (TIGR04138 family)
MTQEDITLEDKIYALCERDDRYKPEAYNFVMAALTYTLTRLGEVRHVTGRELLEGLKELSIDSFGPMAKEVLNHWGVHECSDVGHVVFNLVDEGLLRKTDTDSIKDFEDGFDFEEEFITNYEW